MSKTQALSNLIVPAALAACAVAAAGAAWAADFPEGVYGAKSVPATVTFAHHGVLHVNNHGVLEVTGTYKVDGDKIQFTDRRGPWACTKSGERTGSYTWKDDNGRLAFTTVADTCKMRVESLTKYAWTKK